MNKYTQQKIAKFAKLLMMINHFCYLTNHIPTKMRYPVFILLGLLFIACSKSSTNNGPKFDEIFQTQFTLDGKNYSQVLPKDTINTGYGYLNETSPGNYYFGNGCLFKLSNASQFTILLGSGQGQLLSNWPGAYESFKLLISPGVKTYDSLEHCLQTLSNRVEITFVDENGDIWSSTKWTFLNNIQVQKSVDQPGGNFVITDSKEVSSGGSHGKDAAIIKGSFNCILYKANSAETRSLTNGSFTIYVGMDG